MLGTKFSDWLKSTSKLARIAWMCVLVVAPLMVGFFLLFLAYFFIDVGDTLLNMAAKMHPLQVQLAEMTMATAKLKAQQHIASAEVFERTRQGETAADRMA